MHLDELPEYELLDTIGAWEREYSATVKHADHCIKQIVMLKTVLRRRRFKEALDPVAERI